MDRGYRPEIDGLRAVAVLAVVLFHAGVELPGGYVGVDVFFVISGFLITGIILRSLDKDEFSLASFWERRVRRIFPALAVVVASSLIAGYFILVPLDLQNLGESSVAQAFMMANVHFWRDTGYFAGPAETKPLLHTWSLAVEEQFYLLLPFLLIALRNRSRGALFLILAGLSAISLAVSVYATRFHPNAAFFLLPTRAWELFAGCLLAATPWRIVSRPLRDELISGVGLACILASMLLFSSQTAFPGFAAALPVAGTVAVLFATTATRQTRIGRLLSLRPLVAVGLISYSIYLWHWPILVFVRYVSDAMGSSEILASMALTLVAAGLSWRFVEVPIRSRRFIETRRRIYVAAATTSAAVLSLGGWYFISAGVPNRYDINVALLTEDITWVGAEYEISSDEAIRSHQLPQLGIATGEGRSDFMIWGDSHAMMLSPLIDEVATELGLQGVAAATRGIPPLPKLWKPASNIDRNSALARSDAVMSYLKTARPRNLLLVGRWSSFCAGTSDIELASEPETTFQMPLVIDHPGSVLSPETASKAFSRQLGHLVAYCKSLGIRVWILRQVPETGEPHAGRDFLRWLLGRRSSPPLQTCSIADHRERQRLPDQIFQQNAAEVRILDPAAYCFDANGRTVNFTGGRSRYRDDDHLTRWGAESLRPLFVEALSQMKQSQSGELPSDRGSVLLGHRSDGTGPQF